MKDIRLKKERYKLNSISLTKEEEFDTLVKSKFEIYDDLFIEGKSNTFKINMAKQFNYLDNHFIFTTFLKFFFGIIALFFPLLFIIICSVIDFSEKNNYIFFPCFISLSIILFSLLVLLIIKLGESCEISGLLIYSWERKNIFKIADFIVKGCFLLWFLFACENFIKWYNLSKEKVAQSSSNGYSQIFDKGTYTERILFILFFWDLEKDNNGEYIHTKMEYFEYEDSVFIEFHNYILNLFLPILLLSLFDLLKIIFFKSNKFLLSLFLNLVVIFISLFNIFFFKNDNDNTNEKKSDYNNNYFPNTKCKYFEVIAYFLLILLLVIKSFFAYLKILQKKYISRKKKSNKIMKVISIISFLINLIGYIFFNLIIFILTFKKIDQNFEIESYRHYWVLIYISVCLILFGYSFIFGHCIFYLIYYPIAYEISPHRLKDQFYTKGSGTIIENKEILNYNKYRSSKSTKELKTIFPNI